MCFRVIPEETEKLSGLGFTLELEMTQLYGGFAVLYKGKNEEQDELCLFHVVIYWEGNHKWGKHQEKQEFCIRYVNYTHTLYIA